MAYKIISCLQHLYPVHQMKEKEFNSGLTYLRKFITDFNYQDILSEIQDENKVKNYYRKHHNNYLKLQVFRTYLEITGKREQIRDNYLIKFIDETFHIENDCIYFLDLMKYEIVPDHIIESCDKFILPQ